MRRNVPNAIYLGPAPAAVSSASEAFQQFVSTFGGFEAAVAVVAGTVAAIKLAFALKLDLKSIPHQSYLRQCTERRCYKDSGRCSVIRYVDRVNLYVHVVVPLL